jgi:hypothetical protein
MTNFDGGTQDFGREVLRELSKRTTDPAPALGQGDDHHGCMHDQFNLL